MMPFVLEYVCCIEEVWKFNISGWKSFEKIRFVEKLSFKLHRNHRSAHFVYFMEPLTVLKAVTRLNISRKLH